MTLPAPFKVYSTEYSNELYRSPFGVWMAGYYVTEEVWLSLNGEVHVWDNGYDTCTDPVALDQTGRRYRCYRNRIDFWGGEHWSRNEEMAPLYARKPRATFFQTLRNVPANTMGRDGQPLKVRET